MRLLCIAAAHDPIGYVAVAGRGLDETAIARMTGGSESEVHALLGELERNGVFSRDRHARIYSRRMVRDARRAAIARKNGKTGGNPTLGNNKGKPASDKGPVKPRLKTHKPLPKSQQKNDAPKGQIVLLPGADAVARLDGATTSTPKDIERRKEVAGLMSNLAGELAEARRVKH